MGSCCSNRNREINENANNEMFQPINRGENTKIKVVSKITSNEVKVCKFTPRESENTLYKYECPICMYFYSEMMAARCCKNYVCHFCVEEILEYKDNSACPHCRFRPLVIEDVNPKDKIKRYFERPPKIEYSPTDPQ